MDLFTTPSGTKSVEIAPVFVSELPRWGDMENGKLYICRQYKIAVHLCACGCGQQSITPLGDGGWKYSISDEKVTLQPSIGNFNGERPYHAHYLITDNKIQWLE